MGSKPRALRDSGKSASRFDGDYQGGTANGAFVKCVAWNVTGFAVKGDSHNVSYNTVFDGSDIRAIPLHLLMNKSVDIANETSKPYVDPLTGLSTPTAFGRPDWATIFKQIRTDYPRDKVGVFFCGPRPRWKKSLLRICTSATHSRSHARRSRSLLPPQAQLTTYHLIASIIQHGCMHERRERVPSWPSRSLRHEFP